MNDPAQALDLHDLWPVKIGLDPVENICPSQAPKRILPGHFRIQYRSASKSGLWGQFGGTCGQSSLTRTEPDRVMLAPVLCDQWACNMCGPRKAAWFKRELSLTQVNHGLDRFWTLTVWHGSCTARDSTRLITYWWHILHRRLRTAYGPFAYLWILEHTKEGYAHLHLLTACPAKRRAIKPAWTEIANGSYIVDVQPVQSDRAADYIAKYCTQQARQRSEPGYEHLKGRRMYSTSRDIKFAPFRAPGIKVQITDELTGEVTEHSPWRRWEKPYWEARAVLGKQYGASNLERVQGAPFAVFGKEAGK